MHPPTARPRSAVWPNEPQRAMSAGAARRGDERRLMRRHGVLEALSAVQRRADNADAAPIADLRIRPAHDDGNVKARHASGAKKKICATARITRLGHPAEARLYRRLLQCLSQLLDSHRYLYHTTLRGCASRTCKKQGDMARLYVYKKSSPGTARLQAASGPSRMTTEISRSVLGARAVTADGRRRCVGGRGRFTIVHENELTLDGDEGKKNACRSDTDLGSLVVAAAHLLFNPKRGDA